MGILMSAFVGHLVGDYLLQNDWMALNKKQSTFHCLIHCIIWASAVCLFADWSMSFASPYWPILFATHFLQDRTNIILWYMKKVGQEKFATGICSPWSIIVVDNVFHILTIWLIWKFI